MKGVATLVSRSASRACIVALVIAFAVVVATWSRRVSAQVQSLSDISVLKSGDEGAIPGGQITYEVVVTNGGPDDANNVRLSDPLPAHTTYVDAVVTQGNVNLNGDTVDVDFGRIIPGESAGLKLTVAVDANTEPGTTITNTAAATSDSADNDLSNNQGSASTVIEAPAADLTVAKSAPETADIGGPINYTVQVVNFGTLDAVNVVLTDPIPAHTTFVEASVSQGTFMFDGTSVTANFGTIPVGMGATLFLTVNINQDTPRNTLITNTAMATSSSPDRNPADNVSSAFTQVTGVFPGDLIISEFRLRGPGAGSLNDPTDVGKVFGKPVAKGLTLVGKASPNGQVSSEALDEFIEIYNNTDSPITVNTSDDSSGFAVAASDGIARFVIPNGTTIPARGHFLGVNSLGYSLNGYPSANNGGPGTTATGDAIYMQDIPDNAGIALFRTSISENFSIGTRLDAAGSTAESNSLYKEGEGYPALTNPAPADYSFYRDNCGKGGSLPSSAPCSQFTPRDSDNNAADFIFVDTDGTNLGAGQRLGAPGPENLASPILSNGSLGGFLLDATKSHEVAPNRVRNLTPDPVNNSPFGTLDVRRRFVNNSELPVTRLRFRIIDISTFPSLIGTADLRARTSTPLEVSGIGDPNTCSGGPTPCTVTVRGLTLETPPDQLLGGAFNSSLSEGLITLQTPLAPGESINVRFLFGIARTGVFRIVVNIETLTGVETPGSPQNFKLRKRS
jgi:uncharacterized repeat protein (TIGR01451 family)